MEEDDKKSDDHLSFIPNWAGWPPAEFPDDEIEHIGKPSE